MPNLSLAPAVARGVPYQYRPACKELRCNFRLSARAVRKQNPTNANLSNLRLQDDIVNVLRNILKSKKPNNRLLCEVICHKAFHRCLTDADFFVWTGLAALQIQNLYVGLHAFQQKIENEYHLDTKRFACAYLRNYLPRFSHMKSLRFQRTNLHGWSA